jgi:hypothetical protein
MSWLKVWIIAVCVWGNAALAIPNDGRGGERQDLQTISSWMAHLNFYYPSLKVAPAADLTRPVARQATLQELEWLEDVLHGQARLPQGVLMFIACSNVVCGNDDGGKCLKCSAED